MKANKKQTEVASVSLTIVSIPTSQIDESQYNPRKTFKQEELEELAESIKQNGLIQPITVRPVGKRYEIVCGWRRYKAVMLVGAEKIDAFVRELSDDAAEEFAIVENLQRKDVIPTDEAAAFDRLIRTGKYTYSTLAERVGKSEVYVRSRVKLVNLISDFAVLLKDDELNITLAGIVANYATEVQKDIYDKHFYPECPSYYSWKGKKTAEVISFLNRCYSAQIDQYHFDKTECAQCPFNTANFALFSDDLARCTKFECLTAKNEKHIANTTRSIMEQAPELNVVVSNNMQINGNVLSELAIENLQSVKIVGEIEIPEMPCAENFEDEEDYQSELDDYNNALENAEELKRKIECGEVIQAIVLDNVSPAIKYVYAPANTNESSENNTTEGNVISNLQKKMIRNNELCVEKSIEAVKDMLVKFDVPNASLSVRESVFFYYYILSELDHNVKCRILKFENNLYELFKAENVIALVTAMSDEDKNIILREYLTKKICQSYATAGSWEKSMLREFAEIHIPEDLQKTEDYWKTAYDQKNKRLTERIGELEKK